MINLALNILSMSTKIVQMLASFSFTYIDFIIEINATSFGHATSSWRKNMNTSHFDFLWKSNFQKKIMGFFYFLIRLHIYRYSKHLLYT